ASTLLLGLVSAAVLSQTIHSKPTAAKAVGKNAAGTPKPKLPSTTTGKPIAKVQWEKATAITEPTARISALRKFVASFPKSTHVSEAYVLISTAEAALGNDKLAAGD